MSIVLIGGFFIVILLLFLKSFLFRLIPIGNPITRNLSSAKWFQHGGRSGLFLFCVNTVLFGATAGLLYVLTFLFIPFLHLIVMLAAVLLSFYVWIAIRHADQKEKSGRIIMAFTGSGFYLLLFGYAVYRLLTLGPDTPENDQFMAFIGLIFIAFVAMTAWLCCLVLTASPKKDDHPYLMEQ